MKAPYGIGPTSGQTGAGTGGFFSDVKNVFGEALQSTVNNLSKEVVPNWTAKQLGVQRNDQLSKSTFNRTEAPRRLGTVRTTGGQNTTQDGRVKETGWLFGDEYKGTVLQGSAIALLAVTGVLVLVTLFK